MKLPVIAAAALALSAPLAAQAEATSSAHFSNFHYEVIDLDLNDGIDAALTLDESAIVLTAGFYPTTTTFPEPFDYRVGDGTVGATVGGGSASVSMANGTAGLSASFSGAQGEMFGTAAIGHAFSLTANTRLVLHADADASSTFTATHHGYSHAELFISYLDDPFEVEDTVIYDSLVSNFGNNAARGLTVSLSTGAQGIDGNLGLAAGSFATVSAVPEPSQYAMFALGLAGLGWRLRRSRNRKSGNP
ncbi:PEP-CTERM sorting domain-containing protein [Massilia dura]|uniref:PEP-CTERM sorting domain-containing protein n=1 Tax=Pseudoduganella dura TaxID=321982 RepID=A0A6I3XLP8_9BURK|nr:PEP-CTERM sorting domain-containing protein [Pseudoduganella dura]MUI14611.1 PEP-CTERM sorting domain-containing protein [Pseudoduganella dura]GGY12113.1 hypothetical protein GCM10007386_48020 [Pseudoduganella dura]